MFKVTSEEGVRADFAEIHPDIAGQIIDKIKNYLSKFPRELGKPLTGSKKGLYSHRHGDYRIIYQILRAEKTINITNIGHRRDVYK